MFHSEQMKHSLQNKDSFAKIFKNLARYRSENNFVHNFDHKIIMWDAQTDYWNSKIFF